MILTPVQDHLVFRGHVSDSRDGGVLSRRGMKPNAAECLNVNWGTGAAIFSVRNGEADGLCSKRDHGLDADSVQDLLQS